VRGTPPPPTGAGNFAAALYNDVRTSIKYYNIIVKRLALTGDSVGKIAAQQWSEPLYGRAGVTTPQSRPRDSRGGKV